MKKAIVHLPSYVFTFQSFYHDPIIFAIKKRYTHETMFLSFFFFFKGSVKHSQFQREVH